MSSTEDVSPLGTTPTAAAGASATANAEDAAPASVEAAPNPSDTLSPAVRRLVRQFDLDITGIHGTGPAGRIRVGDVMGLLAGRTDSGNRDAPARPITPEDDLDDASRDRRLLRGQDRQRPKRPPTMSSRRARSSTAT